MSESQLMQDSAYLMTMPFLKRMDVGSIVKPPRQMLLDLSRKPIWMLAVMEGLAVVMTEQIMCTPTKRHEIQTHRIYDSPTSQPTQRRDRRVWPLTLG